MTNISWKSLKPKTAKQNKISKPPWRPKVRIRIGLEIFMIMQTFLFDAKKFVKKVSMKYPIIFASFQEYFYL